MELPGPLGTTSVRNAGAYRSGIICYPGHGHRPDVLYQESAWQQADCVTEYVLHWSSSSFLEDSGQEIFKIYLSFSLEVGFLPEGINLLATEQALRVDIYLILGYVAGVIFVEHLEYFHNIVVKRLLVHFFQHVQQKFLEVNGPIAVIIHLLEYNVNFFLVNIVAEPPQQELKSATGDIASVVSIVHLENFPKFFDLFDFVWVEQLVSSTFLCSG